MRLFVYLECPLTDITDIKLGHILRLITNTDIISDSSNI